MIQLAIAGALGRTGRRVLELAAGDVRFSVAAAIVTPECSERGTTIKASGKDVRIVDRLEDQCDVLIDFSTPFGTLWWLRECRKRRIPAIIGTTGHDETSWNQIRQASQEIPVFFAANFSVGIEAIRRAPASLVKQLGPNYDVEIVETHHRQKIDAPSGTALLLANEIKTAKAHDPTDSSGFVYGRQGQTGLRKKSEIGIHAVRMGDVIGQHEIHLSGPGETITIRHTAHSRDTFAAGALRAAEWIIGKPPKLYSMRDMLE